MTRLGLGCMEIMYQEGAINAIFAKSIKEMLRYETINRNFTYQSLYRTLTSLCQEGLTKYGAKAGKAETYYLSPKGINMMKELIN